LYYLTVNSIISFTIYLLEIFTILWVICILIYLLVVLIILLLSFYSIIVNKIREYNSYEKIKYKRVNSPILIESQISNIYIITGATFAINYYAAQYGITIIGVDEFMQEISQLGSQINENLSIINDSINSTWNSFSFNWGNPNVNIPHLKQYIYKPLNILNSINSESNLSTPRYEHMSRNHNYDSFSSLYRSLYDYRHLAILLPGPFAIQFFCNLDSIMKKFSTSLDKFSILFDSFHNTLRNRFSNIIVRMLPRITSVIIGSPLYLTVLEQINTYQERTNETIYHLVDRADAILNTFNDPWAITNHTGILRTFYRFSIAYSLYHTELNSLRTIQEGLQSVATIHNIDWEVFRSTFNIPNYSQYYSDLYNTRINDITNEWTVRLNRYRDHPGLNISMLNELAVELYRGGELDNNDSIEFFLSVFSLNNEENVNHIVNLLNATLWADSDPLNIMYGRR